MAALEEHAPRIDTAQLSAHISRELDRYRRDVQRGTLPFERKRRIIEAFVQEVRVRLPKGQTLSGRVRETVPYRDGAFRDTSGTREMIWQRESSPTSKPPGIEVRYQFPWPQAEHFVITDSLSPKRRLNIRTSSVIRA